METPHARKSGHAPIEEIPMSAVITICERTGNQRYDSGHAAQIDIRGIKRRAGGFNPQAYRCEHCSGWHITAHSREKRLLKMQRKGKA
jgi:hypothetical protein